MSGKRSGVGGRFKATPPDDNPKVAAIVGEKDEEEMESENNIVVSESETSDRVLRKVVVTDTAAKTDGVNDRNPTTSTTTTTSTSGPKTRATRLRDDAAIVAAAAVVTTKRNRKQPRDLDLKNSSDEENDVTNIDETPPADDDDDKDSETDDADETCFKIDKVYTVSDEQNDLEMTVTTEGESGKQKVGGEDLKDDCNAGKGRGGVGGSGDVTTPTAVVSGVKLVDAAKLKEEKQIKPRIQATATLAKLPAGLGGGVGSVRMLGAGVRGTNMPFIVSMGAGNPGIPLLPAGLPPGRYVILPGSSTTTSKTATVTTMAASGLTTRLATTATGHTTVVTAQKAISAASTTPRTATPTPTPTPSPQQVAVATAVAAGGGRLYTRERGRRKSYTTGEKLAMIEAVEGGQRKSVVADRFGVAPSTLACILAQRHKIRSEKDNLARRRVRHNRYQELREDMVGGGVVSSSAASVSSVSPPHQPFTHFLAPLTSPTPPTFLDTQPEEIIAGMLIH
ncbi:hypothetical protein Pcinc_013205 [Petrolisthes cinctipes]|uniref:HTH psq-type domain-containing protein n=1 Tax=Petrolisthes cinctipes TaxID=88211 RepID=A0AAE1KQL4_PETCI|nr:hypothetical protein Pcinc_013205 [Petrolisthes cinctipes]